MKRPILVLGLFLCVLTLSAQSTDTPLAQALASEPVQASYLARHPEILRWIGKHPDKAERVASGGEDKGDRAKNKAIDEWIVRWPDLARLLAQSPGQTLAWADDPHSLNELVKKGRK